MNYCLDRELQIRSLYSDLISILESVICNLYLYSEKKMQRFIIHSVSIFLITLMRLSVLARMHLTPYMQLLQFISQVQSGYNKWMNEWNILFMLLLKMLFEFLDQKSVVRIKIFILFVKVFVHKGRISQTRFVSTTHEFNL